MSFTVIELLEELLVEVGGEPMRTGRGWSRVAW
jgi:hypothetical protein